MVEMLASASNKRAAALYLNVNSLYICQYYMSAKHVDQSMTLF